jgi:hypothetical protein
MTLMRLITIKYFNRLTALIIIHINALMALKEDGRWHSHWFIERYAQTTPKATSGQDLRLIYPPVK